jgi:hypothetical protein
MPTLDEQIAQALAESQANGELQRAPSYGRPLDFGDGYDETPAELRMPFKVLKDAGFAPPEIEWMRRAAALRRAVAAATGAAAPADPAEIERLRAELATVEQRIALRLEKLRRRGSL